MIRSVAGTILIGFIICLPLPAGVSAQEEDEGFFPPQQVGAGVGPGIMVAPLALPALDDRFAALGLDALPGSLTLYGAEGVINIGRLLVGLGSFVGETELSATAGGVYRAGQVALAYTGLVVGWVKATGKFKLTLGGSIGGGTLYLRLIRRPVTDGSWTDLWATYTTAFTGPIAAADLETAAHLEGNFFTFGPKISARWWFMPLVALEVGASYQFGKIGAGRLEADGRRVPESPELDLSGVTIRAGLFLGF